MKHPCSNTDHKSVRELLTQVVQTPDQQHYLRKLDFTIEYKSGATNEAADALSCQFEEELSALQMALSSSQFEIMKQLRHENIVFDDLQALHEQVKGGKGRELGYVANGLCTLI